MSYAQYSDRASVLECFRWYNVRALARELNAIRNINFSIVEQRQQALQRLGNITSDAPFSGRMRFHDGVYVCEGLGDWSRKFQQLRSALSTKERVKDSHVREGVSTSADISDPLQAFHNALTSMLDQLVRMDGLYTRASFEAEFALVWQ